MSLTSCRHVAAPLLGAMLLASLCGRPAAQAATTVFFNSSQTTNLVSTNATSDTISSEGYLFTCTRDKLFTGGTTNFGRPVRVFWPDGLEAQYVTTATNKAQITVQRVDGAVFDLTAFSAELLANPGAGRAIEIVPFLNGQEPLNDPLPFDVSSGYSGSVHAFDTNTPNHIGSTTALTNYDAYVINLTLDYALVSLTVVDASIAPPVLEILPVTPDLIELLWPVEAAAYSVESATNLTAPVWDTVTNDVAFDGDFFSVQLETTDTQRFFRLRK